MEGSHGISILSLKLKIKKYRTIGSFTVLPFHLKVLRLHLSNSKETN